MKRSKPLRRTALARTPLAPGQPLGRTAIKRKKRKPTEWARCYHSMARVSFVKSLPCAWCGIVGYSQNAHLMGNAGMGRKGDYTEIGPLCSPRGNGCHWKFDQYWEEFSNSAVREVVRESAERTEHLWQQQNPEHISGTLGRVLTNLFTDDGDAA